MKIPLDVVKGRGAQVQMDNRFAQQTTGSKAIHEAIKTQYIATYPKSILNKVESPDLPFSWSLNPYQGCEHGCVYCYARTTHNYWGYGAGLDFESKILYKKNAAHLLRKVFSSKNWDGEPFMLSGNTDCYQPIERKLEITRKILEVCWEFRHPVGIITKNSMILRDLDLLEKMAELNLVKVVLSITGISEEMRAKLEPRTSTYQSRLNTLHALTKVGIPTSVMMAPIIPSINDHEIFTLAKEVHRRGGNGFYYTIVRLNDEVGEVFKDWLKKQFPDRYDRVIHQIEETHGGQIEDKRFGKRMRGEGKWAEVIKRQFEIVQRKCFSDKPKTEYDLTHYQQMKNPQLDLFDLVD